MSPSLILLIAVCESVGVGLVGAVVLRLLRRCPVGNSLIAVIVITACGTNVSTIAVVLVTQSVEVPVAVTLLANLVAGAVSLGIGLLLARSVLRGSRRPADATRVRFRLPDDPPSAESAELARELRITSDELAESRRRERAVEQSRRKLVTWITHDLRGPLARLRALLESIEDGDPGAHIAKLRADTERLTGMVDDLVQLSQIETGALRLNPRQVVLDDLISDEVAGLAVLAADRGIRLRARKVEPVTVVVDDRSMTRVFNNLLGNAIRCSPERSTVAVDVRAVDGWAVVSVTDECGGIPPQDLASVFDMGWRGHRPDTGVDQGGGFGLTIVHGLVQAHGGHVSVHNVPGGCCFDVRLPLLR
ncbi:Signal transduction histidine kinase [Saccharopolyspora antimicrobica]|uniref:histidine kinase n=1 Tax=Saccharopolyspora antimicrobica TaxID=455193 RepID=A0A1I5B407_9PSEU|nr:HAMP domain-containing sensor histidine kinase [Saccharopolyspora antimicrobica]RKT86458.1 signal transduction histidine kinase [Saccharopolyspora antimicrobica]SFN69351.1 Signal transduction histidine kinase [Saccharopolyspora antimicrobica]